MYLEVFFMLDSFHAATLPITPGLGINSQYGE